mmetsp:Transcript_19130/g.28617  ORF Transcript_19130/g.28617 Transcript_19130/m.28617 type:complete len:625 (+) Transcript_19130:2-1876(+)
MLASDPHLTVKIPSFWYPTNLHCKDSKKPFSGAGASAVGAPGIFIGHNSVCAFGITLGYADSEDVFLEKLRKDEKGNYEYMNGKEWKKAIVRNEKIKIKGKGTRTLPVLETHRGPIITYNALQKYDDVAKTTYEKSEEKGIECMLSYAATPLRKRSGVCLGIYKIIRAKDFKEFDSCISHFFTTSLNFGYADINGHFGYVLGGEIPVRAGERGSELYPLKGYTGKDDHKGYLPHKLLPKTLDPKKGYVISANSKIVDYDDYPHYLGVCWKAGWRAQSIEMSLKKLIEKKQKISIDDLHKIQLSNFSVPALRFTKLVSDIVKEKGFPKELSDEERKLAEAAYKHLDGFDGNLDKKSSQATLYTLVHGYFVTEIVATGFNKAMETKKGKEFVEKSGLTADFLANEIIFGRAFDKAKAVKIVLEFEGHLHLNVIKMLQNHDKSWWIAQSGGVAMALSKALIAAYKKFETFPSKDWGSVHQGPIAHKMTEALKQPEGTAFDGPIVSFSGDMNTPNQNKSCGLTEVNQKGSSISLRFLADMGDLRNGCRFITPVGVCAIVGSPFYTNRVERWSNGEVPKLNWHEEDARKVSKYQMKFCASSNPSGLFSFPVVIVGAAVAIALARRVGIF